MIILVTKRLLLKKASPGDAAFFLTLLNSPNWIEFIGDREIRTTNDSIKYVEDSLINSYNKNGYGLYIMYLKDSEKPIGICGFIKRDYLDSADIGFAILPEYEGKGYTYEASIATMEYGKSQLKLDIIFAITTEENKKSQNLLAKIGLTKTGKITPENTETEFLLFSNSKKKV
ncbi:GNAT family N-acetyltransferase [Aquimarina addita]|uniref:GNAT family N-acetyltransferase n=1 Tax=Aquimarina addita TaxID=870485 RepID=A0ABP6UKI0_9FLAO